jgi:hypothetical protein
VRNLLTGAYKEWLGQAVVLQVSVGDLKVPLRGTLLGESRDALRVRIGDGSGWDVDIFKTMIMAVEQDIPFAKRRT